MLIAILMFLCAAVLLVLGIGFLAGRERFLPGFCEDKRDDRVDDRYGRAMSVTELACACALLVCGTVCALRPTDAALHIILVLACMAGVLLSMDVCRMRAIKRCTGKRFRDLTQEARRPKEPDDHDEH